ncbi:HAMP domain-containing protein [Mucilaginibacter sp. BJC16-A38]|uniref:HAMP domain-containing sensor histidine kinase n=1 Tax=Mucilaginibacter phenanthrenivorans TaxID=1234842 RepID=UPI00215789DC|nr:ATP-binding protein [Mucilaginibacter phenanthrenivorans]MCR8559098.1 HAMP domain-containing protein [Mucilaginibacter phenanthrenivorans]
MKIKNRLSLYFTAISAIVLLMVQVVICIAFNSLIRSNFYDQLMDRANVAAKLYLEADEISPDSLSHVKEHYLQSLHNEVIRLYDEKNIASFIKDKNQFWAGPIIDNVRKNKQLEFTEGNRQTVGIYYNDNQGNFVILVSAVDALGAKRLQDLIKTMAILLVCVTAGLFLISRWFAQKTLEPLDKVIGQMRLVRAGDLSLRVDEGNGKDEISALAHNFNRLLAHLQNTFEMQQTFVANASHELRTPITTIIGEIELALNKLHTHTEYQESFRSVLADAERLNETINSLLELANADMDYTQPAYKPVAVDELIWELNDYWNEKAGKGLFSVNIIQLPEEQEKLQLLANKSLLTIALNNIIGNAFKFSKNKRVQCDLYADDENIIIKIIDEGVGILPDELEKVFESFYRGTNVKSFQGNGVGLYVTGKIVHLFNGTIKIESVPNDHTTFTIKFSR